MRKLALMSLLGVIAITAPAQAGKPENRPGKPDARPERSVKPDKPNKGDERRCTPRAVGFDATGTLVSSTLTAGQPGRFDGTLVVNVKRANHGAPKGEQTYTLTNARVKFHHGVDANAPAAGSRVNLHGTITRLAKRCPAATFTPTVTVRKVDIAAPRPAPAPQPPAPPEDPAS